MPLGFPFFQAERVGEVFQIHLEMGHELDQIITRDLPFPGLDLRDGRSVIESQDTRHILVALLVLFPNGLQALPDEVQSHLRLPFLIQGIFPQKKEKRHGKGWTFPIFSDYYFPKAFRGPAARQREVASDTSQISLDLLHAQGPYSFGGRR